jgi:hypothetical protein
VIDLCGYHAILVKVSTPVEWTLQLAAYELVYSDKSVRELYGVHSVQRNMRVETITQVT